MFRHVLETKVELQEQKLSTQRVIFIKSSFGIELLTTTFLILMNRETKKYLVK